MVILWTDALWKEIHASLPNTEGPCCRSVYSQNLNHSNWTWASFLVTGLDTPMRVVIVVWWPFKAVSFHET